MKPYPPCHLQNMNPGSNRSNTNGACAKAQVTCPATKRPKVSKRRLSAKRHRSSGLIRTATALGKTRTVRKKANGPPDGKRSRPPSVFRLVRRPSPKRKPTMSNVPLACPISAQEIAMKRADKYIATLVRGRQYRLRMLTGSQSDYAVFEYGQPVCIPGLHHSGLDHRAARSRFLNPGAISCVQCRITPQNNPISSERNQNDRTAM